MASEQLKQLYAQREVCVRRLVEIFDLANKATAEKSLHSYFKARYGKVDSYYKSFETYHGQICTLLISSKCSEDEVRKEDDVRSDADHHFFQIRAVYYDLFEKKQQPKQENVSQLEPNVSIGNGNSSKNVRLPKVSLPNFDGNYRNWASFYDLFRSMIHENSNLSNVERYQYLLSSLSGEALALVKGLPMCEANYEVAYKLLVDTYQSKRWLASSYLNAILHAPKVKAGSIVDLKHLVNTFNENISALSNLDLNPQSWDFVLFTLLFQKIDAESRQRFELKLESQHELPKYDELQHFLRSQCRALENAEGEPLSRPSKHLATVKQLPKTALISKIESQKNRNCNLCSGSDHPPQNCSNFMSKNPKERYNFIRRKGLCFNCLKSKHNVRDCPSKFSCRTCKEKHHSLLHFGEKKLNSGGENSNNTIDSSKVDSQAAVTDDAGEKSGIDALSCVMHNNTIILLSTLLVDVVGQDGTTHQCRAVLDSGSQTSFITEKCRQRVGLVASKCNIPVHGVGHSKETTSQKRVSFQIISKNNKGPSFSVEALVLPKICSVMPPLPLSQTSWPHLKNLMLADPEFYIPRQIDILIGADLFSHVLGSGKIEGGPNEPSAFNTAFGWVLTGKTNISFASKHLDSLCVSLDPPIDLILKQFWEIEEVSSPNKPSESPEDNLCERIFSDTVSRNNFGRYCVSLPFKETPSLGESRSIALKRLLSLESRLDRDISLKTQYTEFMREYLHLGHMTLSETKSDQLQCYIPHHAVLKPSSSTTKVRVVFDASCKTSNGLSLNDNLLVGPKLQSDIALILYRFRLHRYVFTSDVKQMYRQIEISPEHRKFQKILWRFDKRDPVQEYTLNTVTFGVTSSPFLALRTIKQLCLDHGHTFPLAAEVLKSDIYIDDVLSGSNSLKTALALKEQLQKLFACGQFELRKWSSNCPDLLSDIPLVNKESLGLDKSDVIKVLGLNWSPLEDVFSYTVQPVDRTCTKRVILSELAKIFDPLGFLSPLTLFAKILMQHLWTLGLGWDEAPPAYIVEKWELYIAELPQISSVKISRHILSDNLAVAQLHGFCDASEKGYSAVVYLRAIDTESNVKVYFLSGKTKVSPLKRVSLPRLELCAAVILAELIATLCSVYKPYIKFESIFCWSDSSVALSWIKSSPHKWKTFVSNRVSLIQDIVDPACWFHVVSADNPADVGSRGCLPSELVNHPLWWYGPSWLLSPELPLPISNFGENCIEGAEEEQRKVVLVAEVGEPSIIAHLLERFSSLDKVIKTLYFCLKFCKLVKFSCYLSDEDSHHILFRIVKFVQKETFSLEINSLLNNKPIPNQFRKLNLFIDEHGILRVGGRLRNSQLEFAQKYPALIPKKHRFTKLFIWKIHVDNAHPGVNTLTSLLQSQFWIVGVKQAVRSVVSSCINCFKLRPKESFPLMGDLPSCRVSQIKPFSKIGIDFGGPFLITLAKRRGCKSQKAYICIFVCMATKAVHLELVSDLTSDAFLAAFRRLTSRRGRCLQIFSDNGTNFVGAWNQVLALAKEAAEKLQLVWYFNPPGGPHFAGLMESGIKSVKTHLYRVIGTQVLTYEEFYTVLVQIEGLLNSRPLTPISNDPNDLMALSPSHFLTLEPITAPFPDRDLLDVNVNRLTRWQLVQRLYQSFWKRWHNEYLHTMMERNKWQQNNSNLNEGTMVLVKNELVPPLRWCLGRIIRTYPGSDGIVRVADVRTASGILKRPIVKLCPLPTRD